ncbi:MAG: response regulator [Desulfobacterales bacterium]
MKSENLRIFVVDDNESVLRSVKRLIKSAGYRNVETFSSAEDFLNGAALGEPGLLILDLLLPGAGGIELYHRLDKEGRHVPTVFISALEKELDRARAECGGAVAFLQKPFERGDLVAAVRSAAGRRVPRA